MPTQPTFTCATCDAQIAHHPVFHLGLAFCCAGCAADGPCMCSYDVVVEPAAVVHEVPVATVAVAGPTPVAASEAKPGGARRRVDGRRRAGERPPVDVRG